MNFILFLFFLVCPGYSEFNSSVFQTLTRLAYDTAREYNCGCLYVFQPDNVSYEDEQVLSHFTSILTRGVQEKYLYLQSGMYRYDGFRKYFQLGGKSISCSKSLTIAVVNKSMKRKYKEVFRTSITSVWLVILNSPIFNFFDDLNIQFDSRIYAISSTDNFHSEYTKLFEIYRVGLKFPLHINEVGTWSLRNGFIKINVPRFIRRRNLEGLTFRTTSTEQSVNESNPQQVENYSYFQRIWRELENTLNFSSVHDSCIDVSPGLPGKDGQWTGKLGVVQRGEADVIISPVDFSPWRLEAIQYLLPVSKSRFQIFFRSRGLVLDWWSVFRPFSLFVWIAIIGWIIVGSTVLYCCNIISLESGLDGARSLSFISSFFFVLQAICVQGSNYIPKVGSVRFIYIVSYMVSLIILAAYSGALISSLTKRSPDKPYDNFQQLLKSGDPLFVSNNTSSLEYFTSAQDATLKEVSNKLLRVYGNNYNKMRKYLCETDGVALFSNEETITLWLEEYGRQCRLAKFSQPLSIVYQSMGFNKNSSYTELINFTILRFIERGILQRIKQNVTIRKVAPVERLLITVSIWDVRQIFLFLLCSMMMSFSILCIEICYKKREINRKPTNNFNYQE